MNAYPLERPRPGVGLRRPVSAWPRAVPEVAIVAVAVFLYFSVRGLVVGREAEAFANATWLIDLERRLGVFWEPALQRLALDVGPVATVANWVYIWGHWPVIVATLGWLLVARRERFALYRNALLLSGAIGLVCFVTAPMAPPRFMETLGFVDTVTLHSNAYRVLQPPSLTNQYAAMPSLHVGWNLLMGIAIVAHAGSRPARLFGLLMPAAMFAATILTANHYIADGVVGSVVALTGLGAALFIRPRPASGTGSSRAAQHEDVEPAPPLAARQQPSNRPRPDANAPTGGDGSRTFPPRHQGVGSGGASGREGRDRPANKQPRPEARTVRWGQRALVLGVAALCGLAYLLADGFRAEVDRAASLLARGDREGLRDYILAFGAWAPVVSLGLMVLQAVAAPIPAFLVVFANGLAFGLFWGWVLSVAGQLLAAAVCFWLARALGRGPVTALVSRVGLAAADLWFARWGASAVLVTRLVPGIAFDAVSYAAGLTRIGFGRFIGATAIGVLPLTFVYTYLGQRAPQYAWVPLVATGLVAAAVTGAAWLSRRRRPTTASADLAPSPRERCAEAVALELECRGGHSAASRGTR